MPLSDEEKEYKRAWRLKNLEKTREAARKYATKRRKEGKTKAWLAAWREKNPDKYKNNHLKRKYGITVDQWNLLFELQDNKCAICKCSDPGTTGWATDHDHLTGKVRGILCYSCNWGLGNFKDNILILEEAGRYLRR
jgi:hypothetical protein